MNRDSTICHENLISHLLKQLKDLCFALSGSAAAEGKVEANFEAGITAKDETLLCTNAVQCFPHKRFRWRLSDGWNAAEEQQPHYTELCFDQPRTTLNQHRTLVGLDHRC